MAQTNMKQNRPRTYARNRNKSNELMSRKGKEKKYERDSTFFLKLVICIVLGALWLRLKNPITVGSFEISAVPAGLIVALLLIVWLEKYQFNRKIWYVTAIMIAIFSSLTPLGIIV